MIKDDENIHKTDENIHKIDRLNVDKSSTNRNENSEKGIGKVNKEEGEKMAVSMGVLPVLTGNDARRIKDEMKKENANRDILEMCARLSEKLKKGQINK